MFCEKNIELGGQLSGTRALPWDRHHTFAMQQKYFMPISYFVTQNIKKMCNEELILIKFVFFITSLRAFLSKITSFFYLTNITLLCAKLPVSLTIDFSSTNVNTVKKRQIIPYYYYENNSFYFTGLLKAFQRSPSASLTTFWEPLI